jgi:cytochrome oxidase Cu insertion factor (SCO1/SenC/PrrC family)
VSATPPSAPAAHLLRPRGLFWGVVLLIGVVAAIALFFVGTSSHGTGATSSSSAAPVSDHPAATWAAGKLRAPDISLVDQNGAPFSLASYRGRPVVVTFIDPLCRDYCPLEASHLSDVVRSFPAGSRPAIVAVSVNVRGNARKYLMQDVAKWKLVPQWRWGVGSESQLASVWTRYHIGVLPTTKTVAGVTVHSIVHTEAAYVIDAAGYQRAIFLWPYSADAVTRTLKSLAS